MGVKPEDIERAIADGNKVLAQLRRVCPTPEELADHIGKATKELRKTMDQQKMNKKGYSRPVVLTFFTQEGLPAPVFEHRFYPSRKWQFDLAWPDKKLALEVQGGIFTQGRHTRGAALLKEWEKLNNAACLGWRILYCQPSELCLKSTITMIFSALSRL